MNEFLSRNKKTNNPRKYLELSQIVTENEIGNLDGFFNDIILYLGTVRADNLYSIRKNRDTGINTIIIGKIIPNEDELIACGKKNNVCDEQLDRIVKSWVYSEDMLMNAINSDCMDINQEASMYGTTRLSRCFTESKMQIYVDGVKALHMALGNGSNAVSEPNLIYYMKRISRSYAEILTFPGKIYLQKFWQRFIKKCNITADGNDYLRKSLYESLYNKDVKDIFIELYNEQEIL